MRENDGGDEGEEDFERRGYEDGRVSNFDYFSSKKILDYK